MTISTHLAISNSMSSFVPKYWLNWQILVAILMNFADKDGTTKVYIPVHPWFDSVACCVYNFYSGTFHTTGITEFWPLPLEQ